MSDSVVVGSGPNGLAAALTLARAGWAVQVHEGSSDPGGGCRTEELTIPGFHHDVCSSVHPLFAASPFFTRARLPGVRLLTPDVAVAHPLDGGRAASLSGSVAQTAARLGPDERRYRRLLEPLVRDVDRVVPGLMAPLRPLPLPAHPLALTRYGALGLLPIGVVAGRFRTEEARGLLAGLAAHAIRPLTAPLTAGFGLLLAMLGHAVGWPVVEGGSARIVDALLAELRRVGAEVHTGSWIRSIRPFSGSRAILLDVSPHQAVSLDGVDVGPRYARALRRFRHGPGVCKVDWALRGPVPWEAPACRATVTVHLGGTYEEVARSEAEVAAGHHPEHPFCIVVQPSVVDRTRAPEGHQTLWAYCHVPEGSTLDMTERIEAQLERFAPGFRDMVLARSTTTAAGLEAQNPNDVGGDISGGTATLRQTLFRPTVSWDPYRTPVRGLYLCSSSTPPGGGVHGMCGELAARSVLRDLGCEVGT